MNKKYYSDFQYIGSKVVSLKIRNDFVSLNAPGMKKTLDISHEIKENDYNEDQGSRCGLLHLKIKTSAVIDKQKYTVDILLEGCFEGSGELSCEDFEEMLCINGLTSLYSIARGIIQSVTALTLMDGAVLLPMINVIEYSRDITDNTINNNSEG